MDSPTPGNTQAATDPRGPSPDGHTGKTTLRTHAAAVSRPQNSTVPMELRHCPWLSSVPHRLLERLTWTTQPTASLQGRDILLLYTGPRDGGALDDIITQQRQDLGPRLPAVDILRPPEPNDILDDVFYSTLCCAAVGGKLSFVGGGPNCRTWSILRWFPKPGAPRPVRGRDPTHTWGLESNSLEEQLDTDKDSILLLRQMVITAHGLKSQTTP